MSEAGSPKSAPFSHVNGWAIIARELKNHQMRQKDLAAALGMSQSAITQFKQGTSKFSRRQLARIAEILAFSPETLRDFYAEIIDARILWEPPEIQASSR